MNRHKCGSCGKSRYEMYMKPSGVYAPNRKLIWDCVDCNVVKKGPDAKHPKKIRKKRINRDPRIRANKFYCRWVGMMQRCYNKKCLGYQYYGGRGISVSDEFKDPAIFLDYIDSLPGYKSGMNLTIDRIENDKGYERGNLRWATRLEQVLNRRKFNKKPKITSHE